MQNPQQTLFKMLAEVSRRGSDCQRISTAAIAQIPQQGQQLRSEIEQLRQQIQAAGIGQQPELEDEYLELLRQAKRLDSLYSMGSR